MLPDRGAAGALLLRGGDQRAAHGGALHRHWKSLGCRFQALYTGFLGSEAQIGLVEEMFDWFGGEDTLILVDPVMGDGGKLYQTYTPQMADGMARLCRRADIVVPNMTEACHLLGRPYNPGPYTQGEIEEILQGLCAMGPKMAVLTGVWLQPPWRRPAPWPRSSPGAPLRPPLKRAQTTASAPSSSVTCPGWGRRWRSCAKTIPEPSEASIKVF